MSKKNKVKTMCAKPMMKTAKKAGKKSAPVMTQEKRDAMMISRPKMTM